MIVLDGLDERENGTQLLQYLRDIWNGSGNRIKFLLSSRRNTDFPIGFLLWILIDLDQNLQSTSLDMKRYIRSQVLDVYDLNLGRHLLDGKYRNIEEMLIEILSSRSHGM
jgi:hypothetical protein